MIIPGNIIKIKHHGRKVKFKVLGPDDIITDNCWYSNRSFYITNAEDLSYQDRLDDFTAQDKLYQSNCIGDLVSDHKYRIYFKQLTF